MNERVITSLTNPTVKAIRALHARKGRDESGLFLAEGLKFIGEALDLNRAPRTLLVGQDARPHPLLDRAVKATTAGGGEIITVNRAILEKVSRKENPQTVLGVFQQVFTPLDKINPRSSPAWVALEQVRDPGNLGTIIRTCDAAGAEVTHVDASKKSVNWARENAALSGLEDRPIRWIVEDARKYVAREVRRGSKYHGVILDPPKYGRGPTGEVWRLFEDLPQLVHDCAALLADDASFLLLNAYAARISGLSLAHLTAEATAGRGGVIDWGELALAEESPRGAEIGLSFFSRWSAT